MNTVYNASVGATTEGERWSVRGADLPPGVPMRERLLLLRGVAREDWEQFFVPNPHRTLPKLLGDPLQLPDAPIAVERIGRAIRAGESVCIHGDYDADGVTAAAILVRGLRTLGGDADYYLPHRVNEGFGLSDAGVRAIAARGCTLLVTADCGMTDVGPVALARTLGLDVIVTDHHALGPALPEAVAIVNPRRSGDARIFRHLTGAGTAYMLLRALAYSMPDRGPINGGEMVQLAAIGTVADMAPLLDENRLIVRAGLTAMRRQPLPGVRALASTSRLAVGAVNETDLSFRLGPRLNAAGRMAHADLACDLLLADDPVVAARLALRLEALNDKRRACSAQMALEAEQMIAGRDALMGDVVAIYRDEWSQAMLGIVAGQLVRTLGVPVIAAAGAAGSVRASVRSVPGLDVMVGLNDCAEHLQAFGGHSQAAGFTTTLDGLGKVHARLSELFANLRTAGGLEVDAELLPSDLTSALAADLEAMSPFGVGNPEPLFGFKEVRVGSVRTFGKSNAHLSFNLASAGGPPTEVVGFGMGGLAPDLARAGRADLVVRPLRQRSGPYHPLRFALEHAYPLL